MTPKELHRKGALILNAERHGGLHRCDLSRRRDCTPVNSTHDLDADHVIPVAKLRDRWEWANGKSRTKETPARAHLRAVTLDELIADSRNSMMLCNGDPEGHHPRKTHRSLTPEITAEELPEHVREFAEWYGFYLLEGRGWRASA